jgi:hypothetical protein
MPILVPKIMPKLFPFVPKFGFICFGFVSLFSVLNIHYFLFVWLFSMFSDGFCSFCMLAGLVCMFSIVCYLVSVAVIRFQLLILGFFLFQFIFLVSFGFVPICLHAALYGACIHLLSARSHLIFNYACKSSTRTYLIPYGYGKWFYAKSLYFPYGYGRFYANPFKIRSVLVINCSFSKRS